MRYVGTGTTIVPPDESSTSKMPSGDAVTSPRADVEHVAVGEHDGDAGHPGPRRSVLERRGAGGVGRRSCRRRMRRRRSAPAGSRDAMRSASSAAWRAARRRRRGSCVAEAVRKDWPDRCDSARVLSTSSPRGVAPPVSDDCAPTGSTRSALLTSAATSASLRGNATPAANPPGTCAASLRNEATMAGSRSTRGADSSRARRAMIRCMAVYGLRTTVFGLRSSVISTVDRRL